MAEPPLALPPIAPPRAVVPPLAVLPPDVVVPPLRVPPDAEPPVALPPVAVRPAVAPPVPVLPPDGVPPAAVEPPVVVVPPVAGVPPVATVPPWTVLPPEAVVALVLPPERIVPPLPPAWLDAVATTPPACPGWCDGGARAQAPPSASKARIGAGGNFMNALLYFGLQNPVRPGIGNGWRTPGGRNATQEMQFRQVPRPCSNRKVPVEPRRSGLSAA